LTDNALVGRCEPGQIALAKSPAYPPFPLFPSKRVNYRLERLPSSGWPREAKLADDVLALERARAEMVDLDTLRREQREGGSLCVSVDLTDNALVGRCEPGQIALAKSPADKTADDGRKRIPGWTDRILFASWTDPDHLYSPQALLQPTPPPAPENIGAS
jgi:hypothetical protein